MAIYMEFIGCVVEEGATRAADQIQDMSFLNVLGVFCSDGKTV